MLQGLFEFILKKAGPYAWWMLGAIILSVALLLVPNAVIVPALRDYAAHSDIPATAILTAYGNAANTALNLSYIAVAIGVVLQLFFFIMTLVKSTRHAFASFIVLIVFLGSFAALVLVTGYLDYGNFVAHASEDIAQIEDNELETAIVHLSPREINTGIFGPMDIILNYESPILRVNAIRPAEGLGWEPLVIPLGLGFTPNAARAFSDSRSVADNMEHAQLYRVTFTTNLRLVYSIEEVSAEYFLAQRPLPDPREIGVLNSDFFGTWHYEDDPNWVVEFHENGGGLRDTNGDDMFFSWGILEFDGNEILSLYIETGIGRVTSEDWNFVISGDHMWLQSRRAGARERNYIRVQP